MMYKKGLAFYSGSMKRPQGTQMLYLKARPSAAVWRGQSGCVWSRAVWKLRACRNELP